MPSIAPEWHIVQLSLPSMSCDMTGGLVASCPNADPAATSSIAAAVITTFRIILALLAIGSTPGAHGNARSLSRRSTEVGWKLGDYLPLREYGWLTIAPMMFWHNGSRHSTFRPAVERSGGAELQLHIEARSLTRL